MLVLTLIVWLKVVFITKKTLKITVIKYSIYFVYTVLEHLALNTNFQNFVKHILILITMRTSNKNKHTK